MAGRTRGAKGTWGDLDVRHIVAPHMNMREAIGARGLTRDGFAAAMGVSPKRLDKWLDGAPGSSQAATCMQNDELARAARMLGVSVWYLLDLTDSPDGSGAKPFRRYETLREWWGKAKDPEKAAPWYQDVVCYKDGGSTFEVGIETWRLTDVQGHKCFVRTRHVEQALYDMWDEATSSLSCDPETGDFTPETDAALDGYDAWERWFRENAAEWLKRDLLGLRGDYRNPLAVVRVELEYASKTANQDKFDALLARIDAETRDAMDALA